MDTERLKTELNSYLALEFGIDDIDPAADQPFALRLVHQDNSLIVFEFEDDESYFAIPVCQHLVRHGRLRNY